MLSMCNSAPISPEGSRSLSLWEEQTRCQNRRTQESWWKCSFGYPGDAAIVYVLCHQHMAGWLQDDLGNTEQDFTLFLSVIFHPDSLQLWPSQTPLKSFSKAACSNFSEVSQDFFSLSIAWLHLGPSLFLQRFSSARLECPTRKGIHLQQV